MKDIVLILSDQHSATYTNVHSSLIDTPHLNRIAEEGAMYEHCYCNAPLCVPSRMSFLSGQYPSDLQIFNNDTTLPMDTPTIAHQMGIQGYKTVLIGRMHFKGDDQKHGFDEHLLKDITSQYWGTGGAQRTDFEAYAQTTNRKYCQKAIGGGTSPVMLYDKMVYEKALEYINTPHEQPLFLVIGFYGPHFPYTCEPSLYQKYKQRIPVDEAYLLDAHPIYDDLKQQSNPEKVRNMKAAYCGLVETIDGYIGQLYDAFKNTSKLRNVDHVFIYTSDHGEQCGKRGIFGKQTLYEDAIHVPCIIEGTNIKKAVHEETISLLDISKTILEIAGITWEEHQGRNLLQPHRTTPICIQQILEHKQELKLLQAVVCYPFKLVKLDKEQYLYNVVDDKHEMIDVQKEYPQVVKELSLYLISSQAQDECIKQEVKQRKQHEILKTWGHRKKPVESYTTYFSKGTLCPPIE